MIVTGVFGDKDGFVVSVKLSRKELALGFHDAVLKKQDFVEFVGTLVEDRSPCESDVKGRFVYE